MARQLLPEFFITLIIQTSETSQILFQSFVTNRREDRAGEETRTTICSRSPTGDRYRRSRRGRQMPIDYSRYPLNWKAIRADILRRAGNRCEGSPKYPDCRAENKKPHPVTGSKVVLTIAHLDHDVTHNGADNLKAWCQRCHLTYDAKSKAERRKQKELTQKREGEA